MVVWIKPREKKTYQKFIAKNAMRFLVQDKNMMIIIQDILLMSPVNHVR